MIELHAMLLGLILTRVATLVAFLPIFTRMRIPRMAKMSLVLALSTTIWISLVTGTFHGEIYANVVRWDWAEMAVAMGKEMIFGAGMGFFLSLILEPARIAGSYIGQEMGLTLGSVADPSIESSSSIVGQLFDMSALMLVFVFNLHHYLFAMIFTSFTQWPVGECTTVVTLDQLVRQIGQAHEHALMVAGPAGVILFLLTIALAYLTRVSNQLNIFTVGLPLRMIVGALAMLFYFPTIMTTLSLSLQQLADIW